MITITEPIRFMAVAGGVGAFWAFADWRYALVYALGTAIGSFTPVTKD